MVYEPWSMLNIVGRGFLFCTDSWNPSLRMRNID